MGTHRRCTVHCPILTYYIRGVLYREGVVAQKRDYSLNFPRVRKLPVLEVLWFFFGEGKSRQWASGGAFSTFHDVSERRSDTMAGARIDFHSSRVWSIVGRLLTKWWRRCCCRCVVAVVVDVLYCAVLCVDTNAPSMFRYIPFRSSLF